MAQPSLHQLNGFSQGLDLGPFVTLQLFLGDPIIPDTVIIITPTAETAQIVAYNPYTPLSARCTLCPACMTSTLGCLRAP
jgi:hypothetical protein